MADKRVTLKLENVSKSFAKIENDEVNNLMNWNKILNALGINNIDEVYKNLKKF